MRSLPFVLSSFVALFALGCVGSPSPEPSYPSVSTGYSASLGASVTSGPSAPTPSSGRTNPSDFVVRPDALQLAFVLTDSGADPQKILADLKTRAEAITQRLKEAAGAPVTVRMCGASTSAAGSSGKMASDEVAEYAVRVDGAVDVTLPEAQDYWARSQSIAALVKATIELHAATKVPENKTLSLGFSAPQPLVKDPDHYRARLLERWTARARELAAAAQSDKAPLAVVDCTPPGDIEQRVISLEEIALSLPVSCKLSALRPASP